MKEYSQKTIKNNLKENILVIEAIESFGQSNRFSNSTIFELSLAIEEILTNIIMHGYIDGGEHSIEIKYLFNDNTFLIEFIDDGIPFNPVEFTPTIQNVELKEKQIGGLGIYIIKKYVDSITYNRLDNKNILQIKKHITLE